MKEILIAFIGVVIPSLTTLITNKQLKQSTDMHSARQSILQLIMEDHIRVDEGKMPENYKAVCIEYDDYIKNKGNTYIKQKVDDYFKWYKDLNKKEEEI